MSGSINLDRDRIDAILARIPTLTIGVFGDLFLDRYLDLNGSLTEPSLETGLDAYQVVRVRSIPGAAGTVINNLVALGVGRVCPVAAIGDDGEGYELRQALAALPTVDSTGVVTCPDRRTPTYTKPMLAIPGEAPRELNRLDIHNRSQLPAEVEERIVVLLDDLWGRCDALVVLDQVSLPDCGVVTGRIRQALADRATRSGPWCLADSRERIGLFQRVCLKPNLRECRAATGLDDPLDAARALAHRCGRPVFCTRAEQGILVAQPDTDEVGSAPAWPVSGPIDPVGAGDSTSAGIVCALASGATLLEAAAFGALVASITVQQIGMTGTATPAQIRQRCRNL